MNKENKIEKIKKIMKENKTIIQYNFEEGASWFASKDLNPFSFAELYMISADIIIDVSPEYRLDDVIASPTIFLYRHGTELYIKQILEQINIKVPKSHNIKKLYKELEEQLENIKKDKNLNDLDLLPDKKTFISILEFYSISPQSDELRYSDSEIFDSKNINLFLNFKNAQYHANNIKNYFRTLENNLENLGFPKKYGGNNIINK